MLSVLCAFVTRRAAANTPSNIARIRLPPAPFDGGAEHHELHSFYAGELSTYHILPSLSPPGPDNTNNGVAATRVRRHPARLYPIPEECWHLWQGHSHHVDPWTVLGGDEGSTAVAALRCDQVVEGINLGVEQVQIALMVPAIPADGDSLARHHRLVEMNAVGAAVLLVMATVDVALARRIPALPSGSELGGLATIRSAGPGGRRRADQKRGGKRDKFSA
jgi:hypothetical protein